MALKSKSIYKKDWQGELVCEVPEKHWPKIKAVYERRETSRSGGSLHVHEDEYDFGRGRTLHVLWIIGHSESPEEIQIRKKGVQAAAIRQPLHPPKVPLSNRAWRLKAEKAEAERDALKAERDNQHAQDRRAMDIIHRAAEVLEQPDNDVVALRAERDAMREALAPFVAFADALSESVPDATALGIFADGGMHFGPAGEGVCVGALRKARAASLSANEGTK